MHFFKTRNILKAVASGQIIPLTAVKDEVFSSKMIGVGYAITNHDGYILSLIHISEPTRPY